MKKAIASLRSAVQAFNGFDDDGRHTAVLLGLQHAFEMLLKAILSERGVEVFDRRLGRSISFKRCVRLAQEHARLSDTEAGTLRAIDSLRDDEQHWFNLVSEAILYVHVRAGVDVFDTLLHRGLGERLADYLPRRVLPVSTEAPRDIQLLIDEEFHQISQLLAPGRRQTHEAQGRIRTLLALEAHVREETEVSTKDVRRVQRAVRRGAARALVFPTLSGVRTEIEGQGIDVKVRFTKEPGVPSVRYAAEDEDAAAIREVDLTRRFPWSASELAKQCGLTPPKATAVRRRLKIDEDPACRHLFEFGSQRIPRYSDNAIRRIHDLLEHTPIEEIWSDYKAERGASQ